MCSGLSVYRYFRYFRKLFPTLYENKITVGFCFISFTFFLHDKLKHCANNLNFKLKNVVVKGRNMMQVQCCYQESYQNNPILRFVINSASYPTN